MGDSLSYLQPNFTSWANLGQETGESQTKPGAERKKRVAFDTPRRPRSKSVITAIESLLREQDITAASLFPMQLMPGSALTLTVWMASDQEGCFESTLRVLCTASEDQVEHDLDCEWAVRDALLGASQARKMSQSSSTTNTSTMTHPSATSMSQDRHGPSLDALPQPSPQVSNSKAAAKRAQLRDHYENKKRKAKNKVSQEYAFDLRLDVLPPLTVEGPSVVDAGVVLVRLVPGLSLYIFMGLFSFDVYCHDYSIGTPH